MASTARCTVFDPFCEKSIFGKKQRMLLSSMLCEFLRISLENDPSLPQAHLQSPPQPALP